MNSVNQKFIMIDGIDGSGKSTVINAAQEWAKSCNHRIFNLADWCQEHKTIPRFEDVHDHDIFFTFEPTKAWAGSAVRAMITAGQESYSSKEQAHAFSIDRLMLYRRLILPALKSGKTVIQDRGVSTSIVYQPVTADGPTIDELLELPGNALAIKQRPDILIITDIPPHVSLERLAGRTNGDKEQIFERLELLQQFAERYKSPWLKKMFTDQGTQVHELSTDCSREEARNRAVTLIATILTKC